MPHLGLISGAGVTDTIGTTLAQPLVVQILDAKGKPVSAGTVVRFTAGGATTDARVSVQGLSGGVFMGAVDVPSDADGKAAAAIQLGSVAGVARVFVAVPSLSLLDSASYQISPGATASIKIAPADTAITIGASMHMRASLLDRMGNGVTGAVIWSGVDSGVTVVAAGDVTAHGFGRSPLTATSGSVTASTHVTSWPSLRLLTAHRGPENNSVSTLEMVDATGDHRRSLVVIGLQTEWTVRPVGVTGTASVVYARTLSPAQGYFVHVVDSLGVDRPLFPVGTLGILQSETPGVSANGHWVYFNVFPNLCTATGFCLYRAHLDGSGPEIIPFNLGAQMPVIWPAPSADGSKVAFETTTDTGHAIRVADVASHTVAPWLVMGRQPVWSPDGTMLAYIAKGDGPIVVVNADGTTSRTISSLTYHDTRMSWSPDGKYILAAIGDAYQLVEVATGIAVAVPTIGAFVELGFK